MHNSGEGRLNQNKIIKSLLVSLMACATAMLMLRLLGVSAMSYYSGFDDTFYLKCYYDLHNRSTASIPESEDIVIFDISDCKTRVEIATTLKQISDFNPAVICLDIFMPDDSERDVESDKECLEVLSSIQCNIISPCLYDETMSQWLNPFYREFLSSSNFSYASPVTFGMFEQFSKEDPRSPENTMAYAVAETFSDLNGTGIPRDLKGFCINYRNKEFFPYSNIENLDRETVEGKIVIVGGCKDYQDVHTLPFRIKASNRLPGVVNIAYTINSLISTKQYCREKGYGFLRKSYNQPYKKCSTGVDITISYILCLMVAIVMFAFQNHFEKLQGKWRRFAWTLVSVFAILLFETMAVILSFEFFTTVCMLVPNLLLFVTSILFVDTWAKAVDIFG